MTGKTTSKGKYGSVVSETETKADRGNNEQQKMLRQAVYTYPRDPASFSTVPTHYVNFISEGFQTFEVCFRGQESFKGGVEEEM